MRPEFIDKLMIQKTARHDHELLTMDTSDPKIKGRQMKRRAVITRWRHGNR